MSAGSGLESRDEVDRAFSAVIEEIRKAAAAQRDAVRRRLEDIRAKYKSALSGAQG
ncbi:MAG: hypothetical protein ACP5NG_01095 [Conexivisphaera sp.]